LAFAASACTSNGQPHASSVHPVLGQPKGTPLVVGQPAPAGNSDLGAISCPDAAHCWAVGVIGPGTGPDNPATVIVATKDGGRHWKAQPVSGTVIPDLSGVSCPDAAHCMAVGSNGASVPGSDVVFTTVDGGATWTPVPAPPGALTVSSVECATTSQCTIIVNDGATLWSARSGDFGATWQRMGNLPAFFVGSNAMSCGTGWCLIAGYVPTGTGHGQGAIVLSPDGGQTWTSATVPQGIGVLHAADCVSASVCLAVGTTSTTVSDVVPAHGQVLRSADGGHTWTPSESTPPVDDVFAVACPSASACAMVGTKWAGNPAVGTGAVAESHDGGGTFALASSAYVPITLTALACPAALRCFAVSGDTVARITLRVPRPRTGNHHSSGGTTNSSRG
jgi:photosystem II stability/assembly factor-like uncharacterized protein